jgi:dynein heavy chain
VKVVASWKFILQCRWSEELANLHEEREMLVGDCLISASFLSYTGIFTLEFRRQMVCEDWEVDLRGRDVPLSRHLRLEKILINDVEMSR